MNIPALLEKVRTPQKSGKLALAPSFKKGSFDSHAVDCPFPFFHEGRYGMLFVGWDGLGYQTGLATSADLENWRKEGVILGRGKKGSVTEFNAAMSSILRDNDLLGPGTLKKVNGRFLGTYHAYPQPGYEVGAAVIGLCASDDLYTWEVGAPVLRADAKCAWEAGGLYKSWLMEADGTYYLFYNAKNITEGTWLEQTGVATSRDLDSWERWPGNPVLSVGAPGSFDDRFASDPCVFKCDNTWMMFYFGFSSDGHARESVAFSQDLRSWRKTDEVLIDVGPAGSLDSLYAHKAGLIAKAGRLYHFYCAVAPAGPEPLGDIIHNEMRGISFATGKAARNAGDKRSHP